MLGTFVSAGHHDALARAARQSSAPWLLFDPQTVAQNYNRLPPSEVRFRVGVVPVDARFDSSLTQYRHDLMLDDTIENLEERQACIANYNPEQDALYRPIIETLIGEIGPAPHGPGDELPAAGPRPQDGPVGGPERRPGDAPRRV